MRVLIASVILLLTSLLDAQPYGSAMIRWNGDPTSGIPIAITGFTQSPLRMVSGTNVKFSITAGPFFHQAPGQHVASYTRPKEIVEMELEIGGEEVYLLQPNSLNSASFSKAITFQSTRFPHDSMQTIQLTVKAIFEEVAHEMEGVAKGTILETSGVLTETVTVQCRIFNDLLSWRTTVDFQGNPGPGADSYPSVANVGLNAVKPIFGEMNHAVPDTETMAALSVSGPPPPNATGGRLKHATGIFAFTHGSVTFVEDSNHVPIHTSTNNGGHAAFLEARSTRAPEHPPFNFGIYYACLMASNTTWFGVHFLPLDEPPPYPPVVNQFFAGFTEIVFSLLKPSDPAKILFVPVGQRLIVLTGELSSHAQLLISRLEAGDTIGEALRTANDAFPPRRAPAGEAEDEFEEFHILKMVVLGDLKSTLNRVYLYEEAASGGTGIETYSNWYITRNEP